MNQVRVYEPMVREMSDVPWTSECRRVKCHVHPGGPISDVEDTSMSVLALLSCTTTITIKYTINKAIQQCRTQADYGEKSRAKLNKPDQWLKELSTLVTPSLWLHPGLS
jgi:hypothetical protein